MIFLSLCARSAGRSVFAFAKGSTESARRDVVPGVARDVAAGSWVAVWLLHYEQVNPLSGPFWSHRGYRPLWTSWEARPTLTLR